MTRRTYAPTKYIQGKNELQNLYAAIQHLGTAGAYAVVDPYILDNYRQNIEASFTGTPLPLHMNRFEGECSQPEIDRLRPFAPLDQELDLRVGSALLHQLPIPQRAVGPATGA